MKKIFKLILTVMFVLAFLVSCHQVEISNNADIISNSDVSDNVNTGDLEANQEFDNLENKDNSETVKVSEDINNIDADNKNQPESEHEKDISETQGNQGDTDPLNNITENNTEQSSAVGHIMKVECIRHIDGFHGEALALNKLLPENKRINALVLTNQYAKNTREYMEENNGALPMRCFSSLDEIVSQAGITKDELYTALTYKGELIYSEEQIEALYSGDIALIEELWCNNEKAFAHNGRCYSIWDILDSNLETLVEASVPGDQVIRLVKKYSDNPNFTSGIINFINESTQEGLAEHFGFTAEDFSDIDADFDEMLEYRKKYFPKEGSDPQVIEYVTTLITNLENFEVSASLDVIDDGKIEIGVVDGKVETEVVDGETEIQSREEPIVGEVTSVEDENEVDMEITQITDEQPPLFDNEDVQAA